ncbi:MAG: VWA domain-containing protein [Candidatus Diapherotrites archaeon]
MDAAMAVILLIVLMATVANRPDLGESAFPRAQLNQLVDDSIASMESTGFMLELLDTNTIDDAALEIEGRLSSDLPQTIDLNVQITQYTLNLSTCRASQTFEDCFLGSGLVISSSGSAIPDNRAILHGRRIFAKRQQNADCNLNYGAGLIGKEFDEILGAIMFSDYYGPLYLQAGGDLNVTFDVNVSPSTELSCDENVTVTLGITVPEGARKPVDVVEVMDVSGSMGECAIADGNVIAESQSSLGGGTSFWSWWVWNYIYQNWVNIDSFTINDNDAFDVFLEWETACGGNWAGFRNCIKMYIEAPDGTLYGYYGGTPGGGGCYIAPSSSTASNNIYLAVPGSSSQNGVWQVWAWNDNPAIDVNLTVKEIGVPITKIEAMQAVGKEFIDNALWTSNDYTGLVSFNNVATLRHQLSTDRESVKAQIDLLNDGGSTAIGEGIYTATGELSTSPRARSESLDFQVLLSDGQSNSGRSSAGAAQDAADNNIIIFTIGFGTTINEAELTTIANLTGGQYYYAADQNALQDAYDLIAQTIQAAAADANVVVPVITDVNIMESGGGVIVGQSIIFDVNNVGGGQRWESSYILNFPCSNANTCGSDAISFPGEGAYFEYVDDEGYHQIDFNVQTIIPFLTRDLTVDIFAGEITGPDDIYLDVNVANIADLDTPSTTLNFYADFVGGTLLASRAVNAMCGGESAGCVNSEQIFSAVNITQEGVIVAVINEDGSISECPGNNEDIVNCYAGSVPQFYVIDYYVWRR